MPMVDRLLTELMETSTSHAASKLFDEFRREQDLDTDVIKLDVEDYRPWTPENISASVLSKNGSGK